MLNLLTIKDVITILAIIPLFNYSSCYSTTGQLCCNFLFHHLNTFSVFALMTDMKCYYAKELILHVSLWKELAWFSKGLAYPSSFMIYLLIYVIYWTVRNYLAYNCTFKSFILSHLLKKECEVNISFFKRVHNCMNVRILYWFICYACWLIIITFLKNIIKCWEDQFCAISQKLTPSLFFPKYLRVWNLSRRCIWQWYTMFSPK